RELAIQVAEAFQRYANRIPDLRVAAIYGGQDYRNQHRQLARGVHVVVGTPGRIMDHMERGTLRLDHIRHLVLDEADEMLRMGFIDAVEWIVSRTPRTRQVALFSATMPGPIRKIAQQYLNDPVELILKERMRVPETVTQHAWIISGLHKLDALTRILEVTEFDAVIV
ncbi:MAG: DEAD/DEAH box helicase, partial [Myxococcales bacterium]|nr:DEAD/DEAH box helicase [Myxococcales bacterium]